MIRDSLKTEFYGTPEVAQAFGVTKQTVRDWIRSGRIRAVKLPGGCFRIPIDEVDRILAPLGSDDA